MRSVLWQKLLAVKRGLRPSLMMVSPLHTHSIERMRKIMHSLLPIRKVISPSLTVNIVPFQESHRLAITDLVLKLSGAGDGLSVDEFSRSPNILEQLSTYPAATVVQEPTKKIFGFLIVRPSPLARSTYPLHHAGYIIIDPDTARGRGLGKAMIDDIQKMGNLLGYTGLTGRTSISSPSKVPMKNTGSQFTGVIPNSLNQAELGWMDDMLIFQPYVEVPRLLANPPTLPVLQRNQESLSALTTGSVLPPNRPFPPLLAANQCFNVTISSTDEELFTMEEMIREAATSGNGFALDEFTDTGILNTQLLWDRTTLIVKSESGEIAAALTFGMSRLCRSPNSKQLAGYVIVSPGYRRRGMGSALIGYMLREVEQLGFKAVLTDIFTSNTRAVGMALKAGFRVQGTVPYCGYVHGSGYNDSLVVYKPFGPAAHTAGL